MAAFTVINTINSAGVWQDTSARHLLHMRHVLHRAVVHIAAGTLYVHVDPLKLSERLRLCVPAQQMQQPGQWLYG